MRVILVIFGALLGMSLASGARELFGAAVGALLGVGIAETMAMRARMRDLERELTSLRKQSAARGTPSADSSQRVTPPPREAARDAAPAWGSSAPREAAPDSTPSWPSSAPREAPSQAAARPPGAPAPATEARSHSNSAAPPRDLNPIVSFIRDFFTGGNTLVRVGVVILFIGVAFLLRYIAEHTHVPIQLRLTGVALGAIVLLVIGWRLRHKRPGYALAVQGGAIGILYLTVFASLRLFHVLAPGPAFLVLVLLAAFSAALAILQSSMAFALLAIGCGFLAPVLASTGEGNHVVLFSYYGVLNLGILAIAWFKAWRPLNVVGFLFTFVIGTAWGVLKYKPSLFASTEPFLIAFFLLYIAIAILFSLRQRPILRGYVDGTLVFGVPVVAFGLQSAMVHNWPFYAAYSAVAVSALYLALAWLLYVGKRETQRLLVEAFMALGVAFLTLAVPLALDGRWSAATWALEGAALVWVGCRQQRRLPRAAGTLLQIASGIIFMADLDAPHSAVPVLNSACLGGIMIAFASVFASRMFERIRGDLQPYERPFPSLLFIWGLLWWLFSGTTEIDRHVPNVYELASVLVFLTVTALLSSEIARRLAIRAARIPPAALLPVMLIFAAARVGGGAHPLVGGGWAAWPIAFAAFYFLSRRHELSDSDLWKPRIHHTASALLLIALVAWELVWQVDRAVKGGGSWPAIAWVLVPAVALYVIPKLARRVPWPFGAHEETYVGIVGTALSVYLMLWSVATNLTLPGDPYPLPYVPVLNPLDLAQAFALLVLVRHGLYLHRTRPAFLEGSVEMSQLAWFLVALVFIWLNAILLRTLHYWAGIPYEPEALFRSTLVQTSLTIFWAVLALVTMFVATHRAVRFAWIAGATLMGVVIGKLFLIDLSRVGTVERIVSFVGVGLLMLIVGYFSPLPPARKEAA
ncbi:MAG TPA: DUF2339 domain-containing protein [Steroidobacteraceae bacterium]|nr:DUF2339 domain-containing protein [Steroidobacteraceae bacterium]